MHVRRITIVVAMALLTAGCGDVPLGRGLPDCQTVSNALVLSVEAIEGTEYVPCVSQLPIGWTYVDLQGKDGESVFWLDSDRMGLHFLEVRLDESCVIGPARQVPSDEEGVPLYVDVEEEVDLMVTVVPEGITLDTFDYAGRVAGALRDEETINGRNVVVRVDTGPIDTAGRIARALDAGDVVVDVGILDAEEQTATVILPDRRDEHRGLSLREVIELLRDRTRPPRYRGSWYYPFEGGCITYTFDARGPGVETIVDDVQNALGLWPAEEIRQFARDAGYRVP